MANIVTTANLLFGAMSVFLVLAGKYVAAGWIIFFSLIFDIADGKIARMGKGISRFGKQFDSLADLISFIVAPAVLIFTLNRPHFFLWRFLVCLMIIFCGAFRLARFNIEAEEKQTLFFNGLPTTGFGVTCASIVLIHYKYNLQIAPRIVSVIVALLAMMMVSRLKYPTFKDVSFFQWRYLPSFAIILTMLLIVPEVTVFVSCLAYAIFVPFIKRRTKDEKRGTPEETSIIPRR